MGLNTVSEVGKGALLQDFALILGIQMLSLGRQ